MLHTCLVLIQMSLTRRLARVWLHARDVNGNTPNLSYSVGLSTFFFYTELCIFFSFFYRKGGQGKSWSFSAYP